MNDAIRALRLDPASRAGALIHRGPQAMPPAPLATPRCRSTRPNAALLIDFDNVTMGIRSDLGKELRSLLSSDIIKGKVAVQRAYADWRRYPQYIVPLSESSIDLIFAPAYGSSKKNATDIRLAIDALELVFTRPEIGTFILLSGDSDFSSLVIKLKEYGKYVIGVGIRESSSDLLVQNCDEYYSYNALAGLVKASRRRAGAQVRSVGARHRSRAAHEAQQRRHALRSPEAGDAGDRQHVRREESRHVEVLAVLSRKPRSADCSPSRSSTTASSRSTSRRRNRRRRPSAPIPDEAATGSERAEAAPCRERRSCRRVVVDAAVDARGRDREDREPREPRDARRRRTRHRRASPRRPRRPRSSPPIERQPEAAVPVASVGRRRSATAGERLTRNEAFDLVRRAVDDLATGEDDPRARATFAVARASCSAAIQRESQRSNVRANSQGCARRRHHRSAPSRRRLRGRTRGRSGVRSPIKSRAAEQAAVAARRRRRRRRRRASAWAAAARGRGAAVLALRRRNCSRSASSTSRRRRAVAAPAAVRRRARQRRRRGRWRAKAPADVGVEGRRSAKARRRGSTGRRSAAACRSRGARTPWRHRQKRRQARTRGAKKTGGADEDRTSAREDMTTERRATSAAFSSRAAAPPRVLRSPDRDRRARAPRRGARVPHARAASRPDASSRRRRISASTISRVTPPPAARRARRRSTARQASPTSTSSTACTGASTPSRARRTSRARCSCVRVEPVDGIELMRRAGPRRGATSISPTVPGSSVSRSASTARHNGLRCSGRRSSFAPASIATCGVTVTPRIGITSPPIGRCAGSSPTTRSSRRRRHISRRLRQIEESRQNKEPAPFDRGLSWSRNAIRSLADRPARRCIEACLVLKWNALPL